MQFFLGVLEKTSRSIKKNKPLYAFRQVQPISSVLAISGFELLTKFFLILLLAVIAFIGRIEVNIHDPLEIIFIILRVWLIATSLGMMLSLAACYVPEVSKLQQLIMRPMFFISGIFFSLQDLPQEWWPYLTWNPLLHAVELTRYAAYPAYGDAGVSYFYLDSATIICVFLGWRVIKSVGSKPSVDNRLR